MRVLHDLALLDLTILLKEAGDLGLLQARVDAGDEEVRSGVDGTRVVIIGTIVALDGRTICRGQQLYELWVGIVCVMDGVPVVALGGHGATTRFVTVIATRRRTTVAFVARGLICILGSALFLPFA